ncbi:lysophospholipase, putative [Plasmodium chabaudi chabaudi]|uniref:Lysophospholipase, putative n=1 Tax=Plasmodium chabaudi chabaudi TaxID=31271 RepID=A0A4V0KC20_PLACU|nr:lysophospholipase, putative [Plasmodium chabaudi chabaudi]VTZ70682.1 lysophospholipase, putative [Plasmodium chabaudi chabaudi]|eukprot:XP_733283.2 lysophospholipase, putative [Plasmodium chabaudi chabaudi]
MVMEGVELNNTELRNTKSNLDGNPNIGLLRNKNGLLLKTYAWIVKNSIGNVLLIHGLKAHTRLTFMKINLKMPNNNEGVIVDSDNYYIYKDSWIEKFNQNGYSVYALDLQGHGESQAWKNVRGDFSSFDDLVDDVIQYINQIQDESHNIVASKKKKLPMYLVGYSMGGTIALRTLQVLNEEKEDRIKARNSSNYKNSNTILDNSTNANQIDNNMTNSNDYGSDKPDANGNHIGRYNYLDKLNIKGCVSLSGMMILKTTWNAGNNAMKYLYLPVASFLSSITPNAMLPSDPDYKQFEYINNTYKYDKFRCPEETKFIYIYELIKASVTVNCHINYMPKDIPLLFVHSKDDSVCYYEGTISFHNKAKVKKKDLHIVDDMDHAITGAPGNEEILKKVINWISDLRMNDEDEK